MAHDGIARAIWPVHTPVDGDAAFALATGTLTATVDLLRVGALAADVTADAIVRAARNARGLPGLPAVTTSSGPDDALHGAPQHFRRAPDRRRPLDWPPHAQRRDFFVAGRSLPAPLVFATFLAANIGAGSTIGAASLGYSVGLGGWWWNASAGLGSVIFALWAGPKLWTLARTTPFPHAGRFSRVAV